MVIRVEKSEWRKIFVQDMRQKLHESYREYQKYKKTDRVVYLQQAGNKLFSVVENWLMVKYDSRVSSYSELKYLVRNNRNDRLLLSKVAQLHYFYYENVIRGEPWEFEEIYLEGYQIMKRRVERYE